MCMSFKESFFIFIRSEPPSNHHVDLAGQITLDRKILAVELLKVARIENSKNPPFCRKR